MMGDLSEIIRDIVRVRPKYRKNSCGDCKCIRHTRWRPHAELMGMGGILIIDEECYILFVHFVI